MRLFVGSEVGGITGIFPIAVKTMSIDASAAQAQTTHTVLYAVSVGTTVPAMVNDPRTAPNEAVAVASPTLLAVLNSPVAMRH
ncbi:hypothetical protein AB0O64_36065 [Streptomyces sp. NPDC088341]|uniref:hypothetical protein n=1 Tax=Streptomyces sp. NPDC088341 TaxID=3154870 RepID=UPI003432AFE8